MNGKALLRVIVNTVVLLIFAAILLAFAIWVSGGFQREENNRFKEVERYSDLIVYVDTETGIAYGHKIETLSRDGGWFPLYDAEGNHYRPNGWRDFG